MKIHKAKQQYYRPDEGYYYGTIHKDLDTHVYDIEQAKETNSMFLAQNKIS